jgi:hypothetical protein
LAVISVVYCHQQLLKRKKPTTEYRFRGKPEESQQGFSWRVALRKLQQPEPFTPWDLARKETADLLRKHGGKTGEELKAEGK